MREPRGRNVAVAGDLEDDAGGSEVGVRGVESGGTFRADGSDGEEERRGGYGGAAEDHRHFFFFFWFWLPTCPLWFLCCTRPTFLTKLQKSFF